ncbi:hypothetical protein SH1V18_27540 [Vallitalea longa]|uniref:Uncharacterized protein n=1 Tax=Vallitalea longa TaxID=2936439 RepID=A0A9W6DGY3_9FIRM|nr:hypothetical protein [Vallitalea longa]GKX30274.1 hypothetical protein SH1V18_27540 [Vallitalea longa]
MKKVFTKFIVLALILMIGVTSTGVFAKTNENTELRGKDEIIAKQELIKFAKQETKNLNMSHDLLDEGKKLLTELYMRGYSQEYIASKVKEYGIYVLVDEKPEKLILNSTLNDIEVSKPMISYNSYDDIWYVNAGGYWNSEYAFKKDRTWSISSGRYKYEIGNLDVAGIALSNVKGDTTGVYIQDSYLIRGDQDGLSHDNKINNIVSSDDLGGIAIAFQDAYDDYRDSCIGYRWAMQAEYSKEFGNISCNIKGFYAHTFKSSKINGISFGVSGKNFGVNFNISDEDHCIKEFSQTRAHN